MGEPSASTTRPTEIQQQTVSRLRTQLEALIDSTNRAIDQEFSPLYRRVFGRDRSPAIVTIKPLALR